LSEKFIKGIGLAVIGAMIYGIVSLAFGWLVMILWNAFVPEVFGLNSITYWQGFLMEWLCAILFKNTTTIKTKGNDSK